MTLSTIAEESEEQVDLIPETQFDKSPEPGFDHEEQVRPNAPNLCDYSVTPKTAGILDSIEPQAINPRGATLHKEHLFYGPFFRPNTPGKDPLTGFHFAPFVRPVINISRDKKQPVQSPRIASDEGQQLLGVLGAKDGSNVQSMLPPAFQRSLPRLSRAKDEDQARDEVRKQIRYPLDRGAQDPTSAPHSIHHSQRKDLPPGEHDGTSTMDTPIDTSTCVETIAHAENSGVVGCASYEDGSQAQLINSAVYPRTDPSCQPLQVPVTVNQPTNTLTVEYVFEPQLKKKKRPQVNIPAHHPTHAETVDLTSPAHRIDGNLSETNDTMHANQQPLTTDGDILSIPFERIANGSSGMVEKVVQLEPSTNPSQTPRPWATNLEIQHQNILLTEGHESRSDRQDTLPEGISQINLAQTAGDLAPREFIVAIPEASTIHNDHAGVRGSRVTKLPPKPRSGAPKSGHKSQAPSLDDVCKLLGYSLRQHVEQNHTLTSDMIRSFDQEALALKESKTMLQLELEAVRRANDDLTSKGREDTEKLKSYSEKLRKIQRFANGLSNDLEREKSNARHLHQKVTALNDEGKVYSQQRAHFQEQLAQAIKSLSEIKDKYIKVCTNAQSHVLILESEKARLEKETTEKAQLLTEERRQRKQLEEQLSLWTVDQQVLEHIVKQSHQVLLSKIMELQATTESIDGARITPQTNDVFQLVKELHRRESVSKDDLQSLEISVRGWKDSIVYQLSHLKDSTSEPPEVNAAMGAVFELEKKIHDHISTLQHDLVSTHSLQTQIAELREAKSASDERCLLKDQEISRLSAQLDSLREIERTLTQNVTQVELRLAQSLAPHGAELKKLEADLGEAQAKLQLTEEQETALRKEVESLREVIKTHESDIASITSHRIESESKALEKYNEMRSHLTKEAKRLRQEQSSEFENKLYQANQRRQQAETALKEAQSSKTEHVSLAELTQQKSATALEAMKKRHASAIDAMRKESTAALEDQAARLNEESRTKIEALRDELADRANRETAELRREIVKANASRAGTLHALEVEKRKAEVLERKTEQSQLDMENLQRQHEEGIVCLKEAHHQELAMERERAAKAEAGLEALQIIRDTQLDEPQTPRRLLVNSNPNPDVNLSEQPEASFKRPRRKVDRRDLPPLSPLFTDEVGPVENIPPRPRSFAEIDAMLKDNVQIQVYHDKSSSSELSDVPSTSPLGPESRVLRELPINNPSHGHADDSYTMLKEKTTESRFSQLPSVRQALPNTALRITSGPVRAVSAARTASTHQADHPLPPSYQLPSVSNAGFTTGEDGQFEVADSQPQGMFTPGQATTLHKAGHETGRLPTRHASNQSSSPDYIIPETQYSHKITTYGHNMHKPLSRPTSGNQQQVDTGTTQQSTSKRHRSSSTAQQLPPNKRGKTTTPISGLQAGTQSQHAQVKNPSSIYKSLQKQPQLEDFSGPAQRVRSPSKRSQNPVQQPPSAEMGIVSQSHARSSVPRSNSVATRGNRRASTTRASRYDLRFSQELDGR